MNNRRKQLTCLEVEKKGIHFRPVSFAVCERSSGTVRFRVQAEPDGGLPIDYVAGLMAIHCLLGGTTPEDFEILAMADTRESLHRSVAGRTAQLLAARRAMIGAGVNLTNRESEVLEAVLERLANKEIASRLHMSERTVKFHVSSLLAKFEVACRAELCRVVILGRSPRSLPDGTVPDPNLFGFPVGSKEKYAGNGSIPIPQPSAASGNSHARAAVFPISLGS